MGWLWSLLAVMTFAGLALALAWRPLRRFGRQVQLERACELFKLQRERLEAKFLQTAAAMGKPRGLRWKECEWEAGVEFVRERRTAQIAALVGVTIRFEAIEGSDMEGLPAVANLRNASAVFFFDGGEWHTAGKVVFNMNPHEAAEHFKNQYERVGGSSCQAQL
jgi:hypothetical protein